MLHSHLRRSLNYEVKIINVADETSHKERNEHGQLPCHSVELEILNYTGETIVIGYKNGLKVPTLPIPNSGRTGHSNKREFIIRYTYRIKNTEQLESVRRYLLSGDVDLHPLERKKLLEAIDKPNRTLFNTDNSKIDYEYVIPFRDITDKGGAIYVKEADLLLCVLDKASGLYHPYSQDAKQQNLLNEETRGTTDDRFYYRVTIVDNHKRHYDKFVNIAGMVYKVPITQASDMREGVYITTSGALKNGMVEGQGACTHYSIDDCMTDSKAPILLYNSFEAALTLGNSSAVEERLKTQEQIRLVNIKRESEDIKAKQDETKHLREEKRLRREEDRLAREEKLAERKDLYDHRKTEQSMVVEIVKFATTAIGGILTGIALFKKFSS